MKKVIVFFVALVVVGLMMWSCKSSESCPAYGEAKKFQIYQRY